MGTSIRAALNSFDIACPGCRGKIKIRMQDAYPGNSQTCTHCSATIEFAGDDMRKADRALQKLDDSLNKLGHRR